MNISVDASEVKELAKDMRAVEPILVRRLKPAVSKGALNIKEQLRNEASKKWFTGLPPSISFDLLDGGFGAEIGPDKGTAQGALGAIGYFGGANGGGGSLPDPRGALDAEADRFFSALEALAEEMLL